MKRFVQIYFYTVVPDLGNNFRAQLKLRTAKICHFDVNSTEKTVAVNDVIGIAFPIVAITCFCSISE